MNITITIFSRSTLEKMIDEIYNHFLSMNGLSKKRNDMTIKIIRIRVMLLKCLYQHMKQYNINNSQARIAVSVLSTADIEVVKELNLYNYHKLKIAYDHRRNKSQVSPVQDFYYERDKLYESWAKEISGSKP